MCQKRALAAFHLNESEWGVNVQSYSGKCFSYFLIGFLWFYHFTSKALLLTSTPSLDFSTPMTVLWDSTFLLVDSKTMPPPFLIFKSDSRIPNCLQEDFQLFYLFRVFPLPAQCKSFLHLIFTNHLGCWRH